MRFLFTTVLTAGLAVLSARADAQVRLTITNGQVSLSARNATVPQILAEWARVGQTRIVNAERLTGGPVTIELTNVPEVQALDVLLRNAGGYLLAPRAVAEANASTYDRILVLPPSTAPRAPAPPAAATMTQPRRPTSFDGDQPNELERAPVNRFPQGARPGDPNLPPVATPATTPAPGPSPVPFAPAGVSRPGMMMPVPAPQPGQQQEPAVQ